MALPTGVPRVTREVLLYSAAGVCTPVRYSTTCSPVRFTSPRGSRGTKFYYKVHKIIADNEIDSHQFANLDETGITPNRDSPKSSNKKAYLTSSSQIGCSVQRCPEFRNIESVTIMPVVFASACAVKPLSVVKGKSLNYRVTKPVAGEQLETIANFLPTGSIITYREDIAGINSRYFCEWARAVRKTTKKYCGIGKASILLDGYRSHMSYKKQLSQDAGIILYALPTHTRGITQPLDVSVFAPL